MALNVGKIEIVREDNLNFLIVIKHHAGNDFVAGKVASTRKGPFKRQG